MKQRKTQKTMEEKRPVGRPRKVIITKEEIVEEMTQLREEILHRQKNLNVLERLNLTMTYMLQYEELIHEMNGLEKLEKELKTAI